METYNSIIYLYGIKDKHGSYTGYVNLYDDSINKVIRLLENANIEYNKVTVGKTSNSTRFKLSGPQAKLLDDNISPGDNTQSILNYVGAINVKRLREIDNE